MPLLPGEQPDQSVKISPMKILIVLVLVALVGVGVYVMSRNEDTSPVAMTTSEQEEQAQQPTGETKTAPQPGTYVEYSSTVVAATTGTKILFFHAPWCPQCRALDNSIKTGQIPSGVTLIKVDYDTNQALRQKYGVTIQTTLVRIDDAGNLVEKYVAYDSPTLAAVTENLL